VSWATAMTAVLYVPPPVAVPVPGPPVAVEPMIFQRPIVPAVPFVQAPHVRRRSIDGCTPLLFQRPAVPATVLVATPRRGKRGPMVTSRMPVFPFAKHYLSARGKYRIFNDAEYRFYRNTSPTMDSVSPFATSAALPHTPSDTFADGTWYLGVSYFNGVLDSGFLPIGPSGEPYVRLDIDSGEEAATPPRAPNDWRLELRPAGVVRIVGFYYQAGANRATQWAINYTTDGSDPVEDSPNVTVAINAAGLAPLSYDLPAQTHGTTVKVRVQTRRQDGETWLYSEGSTVVSAVADTQGPEAPLAADRWMGRLPEDV